MRIAFTGFNGLLASEARRIWQGLDYEFMALKQNADDSEWFSIISQSDVIINFAGEPILKRWSKRNRSKILNSRILTTKRIVEILNSLSNRNKKIVFISGSAIGGYPNSQGKVFDETSSLSKVGFLSEIVLNWESEAEKLINPSVRLVIARTGVVLSRNGGMLAKLVPIYKLGLGGKIGSGKQYFSFIHIVDYVNALHFFISNPNTNGIYNLTAPNPTTNSEFNTLISKKLKRPNFLSIPLPILKLIYGRASQLLTRSENVVPQKLLNEGFLFSHPTICRTINNLLQ